MEGLYIASSGFKSAAKLFSPKAFSYTAHRFLHPGINSRTRITNQERPRASWTSDTHASVGSATIVRQISSSRRACLHANYSTHCFSDHFKISVPNLLLNMKVFGNANILDKSQKLARRSFSSGPRFAFSNWNLDNPRLSPFFKGPYSSHNYSRLPDVFCRHQHRRSSSSSSTGAHLETGVEQSDGQWLKITTVHRSFSIHVAWLRDHCRCSSCYNTGTGQRETTVNPFDEQSLVVEETSLQTEGEILTVKWGDGHASQYDVAWIRENSFPLDEQPQTCSTTPGEDHFLWNADTIQRAPLPSVTFDQHMQTEDGLRQTLKNLVTFGFSLVDETPTELSGTQSVVERVAPVQHTLFGGMFLLTSDQSRADTAYQACYLGPHTDNTYLESPAGLQVFHLLHHDGLGGETLLVDGFQAIQQLDSLHPWAVECLSSHLVPHEYKEPPLEGRSPGYHMYTLWPVVRLHPGTRRPEFIRFNPYDRAPLSTIPPNQLSEFYQAYRLLTQFLHDPCNHLWLKLKPGTTVLIDNWRVLHGRAAFTGKRVMSGCYLPRDETWSKIRVRGLV